MKVDFRVCDRCFKVTTDPEELLCRHCHKTGDLITNRISLHWSSIDVPTHQELVHDLMEEIDLPLPNEEVPEVSNLNFKLYRKLVAEEAKEFDDAMTFLEAAVGLKDNTRALQWWAKAIDAICDIDVVIHNASNAMGVDTEPFFQAVHRANLQKADGPLDEDGKRLKPPGWKEPPILEMLMQLIVAKHTEAKNGE